MNQDEMKSLAKKLVSDGVQPSKEQLDSMTGLELYEFSYMVDKLKRQHEREVLRREQLKTVDACVREGKSFQIQGSRVWTVTPHALVRFIERGPQECKDPLGLMTRDLTNPTPARIPKKGCKLLSLVSHGMEHADYYFGKLTGLLYVVVRGDTIKTVHRNESKRWKRAASK